MTDGNTARQPLWVTAALLGVSAVLIVVFVLLGNWQVRRLVWKQELIAAVDARAFGEPAGVPTPFDPHQHAYLRASVDGRLLDQPAVLVKAVTGSGPGYWVMSPIKTDRGVLWVNRGYVPAEVQNPADWSPLSLPITGLLRPGVSGGTLLERNDPAAGRWVSRDPMAMSKALNLGPTLPYFIDADHQGASGTWPRGGLTVVRFRNPHLAYALTWYAMAALFAAALAYLIWSGRVARRL
ncbi:SURF1 family protein [Ruegeria halocynthiae]|uniref:SURF1 family protein n=1 Tax=Ruegeria halocynthiae TaxID=985054 RepID=UPI000564306F|nr:SURF1 family cytochrome oxidase biogenesis protein [Ruegeria halocynthiae]